MNNRLESPRKGNAGRTPLASKHKNPIEAEADMLRKSICAAINNLPPREKDAFYQAMADALRKAFNTETNILEQPRPIKPGHRLVTKSLFQSLSGKGTKR